MAVRNGPLQVTIRRASGDAAGASLPTVTVEAGTASGADGTTEGTGSYTTRSTATSTRMDLSLRETPQSVTVIGRQQIEDQNLVTLDNVLRQTPGIVADRLDERVTFSSRGFALGTMIDGVPTLAFNTVAGEASMLSTAIYDRVEVIRGSAGLLNGVGSPGGVVNLVRKRPTSQFSATSRPAPDRGTATRPKPTWAGRSMPQARCAAGSWPRAPRATASSMARRPRRTWPTASSRRTSPPPPRWRWASSTRRPPPTAPTSARARCSTATARARACRAPSTPARPGATGTCTPTRSSPTSTSSWAAAGA